MITLHLGEALTRYTSGEAELRLEAATVGDALEQLFARHPETRDRVVDTQGSLRRHLIIFKNGQRAALEAALVSGDEVEIVAAMAGGQG